MIKEMSIENIRSLSIELLSKTFLELRQHNITEDDIVSLSLILAEDLQKDFKNMYIEDIKESFRLGIRTTDDFLIGPKVWYKWIKKHRQIIWDNETIKDVYKDKRLSYRSPGIKSITNTINKLNILTNDKRN
tara:strand:- start:1719 stop:2114 length:396 start_codon:yes stop_codon:yes gene_type:complete